MLIYIATFIVISLLFNALWFYAAHKGRLLAREADPRVVRAISRAYPLGPVWYAIAFALVWFSPLGFSPLVGIICSAALAIYFAVFGRGAI
jgi:hypothetical protein